jgi:BatD DUF11 like domain
MLGMIKFLQHFLFLFLVLVGVSGFAQLKFYTLATPQTVGKNDLVEYKIVIENATSAVQIIPPSFKNFELQSNPSYEKGTTVINGDIKKYEAYNYVLKPKAAGKIYIEVAKAIVNGKILISNNIVVNVSNVGGSNGGSSALPYALADPFEEAKPVKNFSDYILKDGEDATEKINKNMFLQIEVDKTTCYVGQPITASIKLFTRLKSESDLTKNPSFNGFSLIELQDAGTTDFTVQKVQGRDYNVYTARKVQLYALQSGNIVIESAEIENKIKFIKAAYAQQQPGLVSKMFEESAEAFIPPEATIVQKVALQSKPVNILVKPLPTKKVPLSFNGAVGNFKISASINQTNFSTDDVGKLTVEIVGSGNLQLINAPEIVWPKGLAIFDSSSVDYLDKNTIPVSGSRAFNYTFTIDSAGTYNTPKIEFSYFDVNTASYKTLQTNVVNFTASKGVKIKTIPPNNIIKAKNSDDIFSNKLLMVSGMAFVVIIGLLIYVNQSRKNRKKITNTTLIEKSIEKLPKDLPLQKIDYSKFPAFNELENTSTTGFFEALKQSIKNYVGYHLQLPSENLSKQNLIQALQKNGTHQTEITQMQQLLDDIDFQLYTPMADAEKKLLLYKETKHVAEKIFKQN